MKIFFLCTISTTGCLSAQCDGKMIISQFSGSPPTRLFEVEENGGIWTFDHISDLPGLMLNAFGFNPLDGNLYATNHNGEIHRVSVNGTSKIIGIDNDLTNRGVVAGDFDNNGVYINQDKNRGTLQFYKVTNGFKKLAEVVTYWNPSSVNSGNADFSMGDLIMHPHEENTIITFQHFFRPPMSTLGFIHFIDADLSSPTLGMVTPQFRIDQSDATIIGALFVNDELDLFAYGGNQQAGGDQDRLILIDLQNQTTSTVSIGPTATGLDGCSCPERPPENCHNEKDDDGDGLIDCYDPDCACEDDCKDHYLYHCPDDCIAQGIPSPIEVEQGWRFRDFWHPYNVPIVGDIDDDGIPEIIGKRGPHIGQSPSRQYDELVVLDGSNGNLEFTLSIPSVRWVMSAVAIGDLDRNGRKEIVVVASDFGPGIPCRVFNYEYDGNGGYVLKWSSDAGAFENLYLDRPCFSPHLADFDGDGISEVYVLNKIFDGQNGKLILDTQDPNFIGRAYNTQFFNQYTVAIDILPTDCCADCEGLELVAGARIYSVYIDKNDPSKSRIEQVMDAPIPVDGFNGVADVDRDGDLDLLLTHGTSSSQAQLIIWDGQTSTLLAPIYSFPSQRGYVSIPSVADIDQNGKLDIAISGSNSFRVLEFDAGQFSVKWQKNSADFSGILGSTLFDLNGDGLMEVLFRDEDQLKIYNSSGQELWRTSCTSGSGTEYPVVIDANGNDEAEILCSCGNDLIQFRSASASWVETRQVWNQHLFHNTNINDDLTIPSIQQAHHNPVDSLGLNSFQTPFGRLQISAPDLSIDSIWRSCENGTSEVHLRLCNVGLREIEGQIPFSVYSLNPLTHGQSKLIDLRFKNLALGVDSCTVIVFENFVASGDTLYIISNDSGTIKPIIKLNGDLPNTDYFECDFANNISALINASISVDLFSSDTSLCGIDTLIIAIEENFHSVLWSDGSTNDTLVITQPGIYSVIARDSCGKLYTDTISVSSDTFFMTMEEYICPKDSIEYSGTYYKAGETRTSVIPGNPCDTVVSLNILAFDTLEIQFELNHSCKDGQAGSIKIAKETYQGLNSWKWEDGSTDSLRNDLAPGQYILSAITKEGCPISKLIEVHQIDKPNISLTVDPADCHNNFEGTLAVTSDSLLTYAFEGQQFSTNNMFVGAANDTIKLTYRNHQCSYDTSAVLAQIDTPIWKLEKVVGGFCGGQATFSFDITNGTDEFIEEYRLIGIEDSLITYDGLTATFTTNKSGQVTAFLMDTHGCEFLIPLEIEVAGSSDYFVPNVFTPNGDQLNDIFTVFGSPCIKRIIELRVFDRWGETVFAAFDFSPEENGWDGRFQGESLNPGVFTYYVKIESFEGATLTGKGSVTLLK